MATTPRVGLLPWGDVIEDWLGPLGVTFDDFCEEMTGGWIFGYVQALASQGIETTLVFASESVDRPVRRTHRPTGASIRTFPAGRRASVLRRPHRWQELPRPGLRRAARAALWNLAPYLNTRVGAVRDALRADQCTGILAQDYETPRFDVALAIGRQLGIPVFASFQGGSIQLSKLEALVRPHTIHHTAGLIIPAGMELARARDRYGLPATLLAQIPNPLDTRTWSPGPQEPGRSELKIPATAEVIAAHGRIDLDDKGIDLLLPAWRALRAARPERDVRLLLIGSGRDHDRLRAAIDAEDSTGLHWVDEFVIDQDRLVRLLRAADVYAFAGRYEGAPVALTEAMAVGLAPAATAASGVPDIIGRHSERGLLVTNADRDALEHGLGRLLDDPALRAALRGRALAWIDQTYSVARVGEQLATFMHRQGLPRPT